MLLVGYKFSSSEFKEGQIWLIAATLDLKKEAYNYCIHQQEDVKQWLGTLLLAASSCCTNCVGKPAE